MERESYMKKLIILWGILILLSGCGHIEEMAVTPTTSFEVTPVSRESVIKADSGLFSNNKADDN